MPLPPLDELKQLQEQATPGPWAVNIDPDDVDMTYIYDELGRLCLSLNPVGAGSAYCPADLELAALAPDLLAEVIRMRERVADTRDMARQISTNPTIMTTEQHLFADIADELDETLGEHQ